MLRSGGRELWFYHAAAPPRAAGGTATLSTATGLLHWLAFRHGATGVHFWNQYINRTSGWIDETSTAPFWPQVYLIGPDTPGDVRRSRPSSRAAMGVSADGYRGLHVAENGKGANR